MKKNKKFIVVAGLLLIVIGAIYLTYFFTKYDVLACNSKEGKVILLYDDSQLVNFGTTGSMAFNFANQKSYIEKIGVDKFITSFEKSFEKSTNGKCRKY